MSNKPQGPASVTTLLSKRILKQIGGKHPAIPRSPRARCRDRRARGHDRRAGRHLLRAGAPRSSARPDLRRGSRGLGRPPRPHARFLVVGHAHERTLQRQANPRAREITRHRGGALLPLARNSPRYRARRLPAASRCPVRRSRRADRATRCSSASHFTARCRFSRFACR